MNSKQIMERGRDALKGNWGKAAIFTLILVIAILVVSGILDVDNFVKEPVYPDPSKGIEGDLSTLPAYVLLGLGFALISTILWNAVSVGEAKIFIHLVDNGEFNWKHITHGLHKLGRNTLSVLLYTLVLTCALGLIGGGIIFVTAFISTLTSHVSETAGIVIFVIGAVILAGIAGFFLYKFLPTYIMLFMKLALDDKVKSVPAIKETFHTVAPYNWEFCCLSLRFTGWLLLCCVTCGIGFLWVSPYMSASFYVFYKECIADQENYSNDEVLTVSTEK